MNEPADAAHEDQSDSSRSFAGDPRQAWSLQRSVDALASAARASGRVGSIWLAGLAYPTIGLGIAAGVIGSALALEATPRLFQIGLYGVAHEVAGALTRITGVIVLFPVLFLVFRAQVGLARIAPPAIWERLSEGHRLPRLRQAMRAGKGLTASSFGMWLMLTLMMTAVIAVLFTPVVFLIQALASNVSQSFAIVAWIVLLLPGLVVLMLYGILLSVLHQLALQSLAHNRRGVTSALVHAWRLAKNDVWSTGRTVAVDVLLDLSVWILSLVMTLLGSTLPAGHLLAGIVTLMLVGFTGVTRAGYWARAYRALGGLSPDDHVPGLNSELPELDSNRG